MSRNQHKPVAVQNKFALLQIHSLKGGLQTGVLIHGNPVAVATQHHHRGGIRCPHSRQRRCRKTPRKRKRRPDTAPPQNPRDFNIADAVNAVRAQSHQCRKTNRHLLCSLYIAHGCRRITHGLFISGHLRPADQTRDAHQRKRLFGKIPHRLANAMSVFTLRRFKKVVLRSKLAAASRRLIGITTAKFISISRPSAETLAVSAAIIQLKQHRRIGCLNPSSQQQSAVITVIKLALPKIITDNSRQIRMVG